MKNLKRALLVFLWLCIFPPLHAGGGKGPPSSWDEVLIELSDLRHEVKAAQVDFDILREKLTAQKAPKGGSVDPDRFLTLEKKVTHLDTLLGKLTADVRTLNTSLSALVTSLTALQEENSRQKDLLSSLSGLQGTLTHLTKAIQPSKTDKTEVYRVQAGDSLSVIAKKHHVSVDAIKKCNPNLDVDKIKVGQEIQLPRS